VSVVCLSSSIAFLLPCSRHVTHKFFASCRDDEEPSKAATCTPSIPPAVDNEPPAQEVAPRVTKASVKKVPVPRNPKRLKKTKEPKISLEAHESSASPHDVSNFPYFVSLAHTCASYTLFLSGFIEEIRRIGHRMR
jgi:hypothetical protein